MIDSLKQLVGKPREEFTYFLSMPRSMRVLLTTNMIYALVMPIVEIFVAAYIMRNSNSPILVIIYQLAIFTAIPFTFMLNGVLLRKINVVHLYSAGMLSSGLSMVYMMSLGEIGMTGVAVSGLIMGCSCGFFWSNRNILSLHSTSDASRNYFFGVESFFYTSTGIVVPIAIGWFIANSTVMPVLSLTISNAYQLVTASVFLLTIISSIAIHRARYDNPEQERFMFLKYDTLWYKLLFLAGLKGLAQGYFATVPAILIMRLVGDEGTLGTVQSISGIVTAIILYIIGRVAKPHHRIHIICIGVTIFLAGCIANGILFSATGVIIFIICKVIFHPLFDVAYFPLLMRVIDTLSVKNNRSTYAYICNHELGLFCGRLVGLGVFIALSYYGSELFALKYSLIIVATLQLIVIPVAKQITRQTDSY